MVEIILENKCWYCDDKLIHDTKTRMNECKKCNFKYFNGKENFTT